MTEEFKQWYLSNKNYFHVKHYGNEEKMIEDARESFRQMKIFESTPIEKDGKKSKKTKPNPYGFY